MSVLLAVIYGLLVIVIWELVKLGVGSLPPMKKRRQAKIQEDDEIWKQRLSEFFDEKVMPSILDRVATSTEPIPSTHAPDLATDSAHYRIPLLPGPNLISIPVEPTNGDIKSVFGAESAISLVMTYDNPTGLWLVAYRDTAPESPTFGEFITSDEFDLSTIDARHAYWVLSNEPLELPVPLPTHLGGMPILPPSIEVYEGWNLVPVVGPNHHPAGSRIDAADYFKGLNWKVAISYNTSEGHFETVQRLRMRWLRRKKSGPGPSVEFGRGYFVYVEKDGSIVPHDL